MESKHVLTEVMNRETVLSSVHPVFRFVDPANVGNSLLDGNEDHLLNQARSKLMMQEHQVGSLTNFIEEQQLEDALHGDIESRSEQSGLQKKTD